MNITTIEPQGELKQVVRQFWYANTQNLNDHAETYSVFADGAPGFIFQHSNGRSAIFYKDGSPLPISFAYGQSTISCLNEIKDSPFIFGINFQPTTFKSLFTINTSEITNSILSTEYIFSKQFNDRLLNASTPQNIIRLFNEKLLECLANYQQDKVLDKSISLIIQNTTASDSKILSSYFNISRRQFQRKFKDHVGVSPETYVRIVKFQKSIHLLKNRLYGKLSDISYGLNYADQSHFIREFKLFSGCTPKEFLKTSTIQQSFNQNSKHLFEPLRIVKH